MKTKKVKTVKSVMSEKVKKEVNIKELEKVTGGGAKGGFATGGLSTQG